MSKKKVGKGHVRGVRLTKKESLKVGNPGKRWAAVRGFSSKMMQKLMKWGSDLRWSRPRRGSMAGRVEPGFKPTFGPDRHSLIADYIHAMYS